jgi:hypothetical protein
MTTTTWTFAPAGLLGQGIADVRPYPGVVVTPAPEAVRGTGLPTGGFAPEARWMTGDEIARLRPPTRSVLARPHAPVAQNRIAQQSTQNDDTTLGIRSPGRPQS